MLGFHIKWVLISLVPIVVWVGLHTVTSTHLAVQWFIVATVLLLVCSAAYAWARRATTRYMLTDRRIYIKLGLFSRTERSTSLDRVQNVEVAQSLLQRLLGIGNVEWATAGSDESDADFTFVGIEDPAALMRLVHDHTDTREQTAAQRAPDGV